MPSNNHGVAQYERGRERENKVRSILQEDGWFVVRSAGSRGPFDLVLTKSGYTVFAQIKSKYTADETQQYIELAQTLGVDTVYIWRAAKGWFAQYTRWFGQTYGSWLDDIRSRMNTDAENFAQIHRLRVLDTMEAYE